MKYYLVSTDENPNLGVVGGNSLEDALPSLNELVSREYNAQAQFHFADAEGVRYIVNEAEVILQLTEAKLYGIENALMGKGMAVLAADTLRSSLREALRAAALTLSECERLGVDESDIELLKTVID
jgi:hypothetical protein